MSKRPTSKDESRPPTLDDLLNLCKSLNKKKAKYVVVGGMAMIQHGFVRATEDIDLLVATTKENEKHVIDSLSELPDGAAAELKPGDIDKYEVIRVADEIVVDLMKSACGVSYADAKPGIQIVKIEGVSIPFASVELMVRLKQGMRDKDRMDLAFLQRLTRGM